MASNLQTSSISLPIDRILVDYEFNVRSRIGKKGEEHYRGIEELAADLKRDGQLAPVMVRPVGDDKYQLIAGFRRMEALKSINAASVIAIIREMDDVRAKILNAKENTARDSITSYDFAKRCVELRDRHGMTQAKIAAEFAAGTDYQGEGMSRSYVGNLMRAIDRLHPEILEAWKNGDPGLSVATLIKWGAIEDHDEQMENWNELRGVDDESETTEQDGSEEGNGATNVKKSARKASAANLVAALRAVKNDPKLSETQQDAMIAVFQFALGKTKTLRVGQRVVFDPKAKKAKEAAEATAE